MAKLDATHFRYLKRNHFRILTAIEMGMKNHEYVPDQLVAVIAKLERRLVNQLFGDLINLKMIQYQKYKSENGYRLTGYGYDMLSLRALTLSGAVASIGSKVGVGKESDIYVAKNSENQRIILKFHRLGRNSFRKIKEKRDYLEHRSHINWIYASRIAAQKEFAFMKKLHEKHFPVPVPIAQNRHCIAMSLIDGFPLNQVSKMEDVDVIYESCRQLIIKLAEHGLIHCDFNEFNLMIDSLSNIYVIDFPQMVSTNHINASFYFERDFNGFKSFFEKRFDFTTIDKLNLSDIEQTYRLDEELLASGVRHIKSNNFQSEYDSNDLIEKYDDTLDSSNISTVDIDLKDYTDDDITILNDTDFPFKSSIQNESMYEFEIEQPIKDDNIEEKNITIDINEIRNAIKKNLTIENRKKETSDAIKNSRRSVKNREKTLTKKLHM